MRQGLFIGLLVLLGVALPLVAEMREPEVVPWFGRSGPAEPAVPEIEPLTARDRVLVLAPHEDDETLGAAGVIQQAVAVGAAVRVVYLTYGDHNELAFLLYRKRPWLTPAINRQMGEVRRAEAMRAMAYLGLAPEQLVFLGYPDHGTFEIWEHHWAATRPYHSWLTGSRAVPYRDASSYGKPYKGDAIVADVEQQLLNFRPTRVFVSHPADGNPDHRAYYLFLQVALLDVADRLPRPVVYAYPTHMGAWPRPLGSHPDLWLPLPRARVNGAAQWRRLVLTPDQANRKAEAIRFYRSQTADRGNWLVSFARRDELFMKPVLVDLPAESTPAPVRSHGRATVATPETDAYEQGQPRGNVRGVSYQQSPTGLVVRITVDKPIEEGGGFHLYAFGYRRGRPFGEMPKLAVRLQNGELEVTGAGDRRGDLPARMETGLGWVRVLIPWSLLGEPEEVFTQIRGLSGDIPVSQTGWQVLARTPDETAAVQR